MIGEQLREAAEWVGSVTKGKFDNQLDHAAVLYGAITDRGWSGSDAIELLGACLEVGSDRLDAEKMAKISTRSEGVQNPWKVLHDAAPEDTPVLDKQMMFRIPCVNDSMSPVDRLLEQRVLLGKRSSGELQHVAYLPSPSLAEGLFYEHQSWILSGHKKTGKSWALLNLSLDCIRAGKTVVYLDFENGDALFDERIAAQGVSSELLDVRFVYLPFPAGLTAADWEATLSGLAERYPDCLVLIDSFRGIFDRLVPDGNVNNPQHIERVYGPAMAVAKTARITVGTIDHAKQSGSETDDYAMANSFAKSGAVDTVYFWTKVEDYSETKAGSVRITVSDDRRGKLPSDITWKVGGQGIGNRFVFTPTTRAAAKADTFRDRVREYMATTDVPQTMTAIVENVKGDDSKIRAAVKGMASDSAEHVHVEGEGRNARYVWDLTR